MGVSALRAELERVFPDRPFSIEFWDGTSLPATNGQPELTFRVRSKQAIAHALRAPGQLGIGRAYVSGALDPDDLDGAMHVVGTWQPPHIDRADQARLVFAAVKAAGLTPPPRRPAAELPPKGRRHTTERDKRAVRHHYDISNDFFRLFLDDSMTYSCAVFSRGAKTLDEAQRTKLELVCTKLALAPGQRVLDVGCGWGSFAIHAAREHKVHVTGITLSEPQARLARERAQDAGVGDLVDIRVADYREIESEPFDAITSIGMVEHVGDEQIDVYARRLHELVKPGGRLLNHGIARLRHNDPPAGPFSERYVFPDADPLHLSRIQLALERAGFVTDHVEGLADDYVETLHHWARRLDDNLDEAARLVGAERMRVWRLYLRAARHGFESGFTGIFQVRCRRPAGP